MKRAKASWTSFCRKKMFSTFMHVYELYGVHEKCQSVKWGCVCVCSVHTRFLLRVHCNSSWYKHSAWSMPTSNVFWMVLSRYSRIDSSTVCSSPSDAYLKWWEKSEKKKQSRTQMFIHENWLTFINATSLLLLPPLLLLRLYYNVFKFVYDIHIVIYKINDRL